MFQTPSTSVSPGRQARYSSGPFLSITTGSATVRPAATAHSISGRGSNSARNGQYTPRMPGRSAMRRAQLGLDRGAEAAPLIGRHRLAQRDQPLALGPPPALYGIEVHAAAVIPGSCRARLRRCADARRAAYESRAAIRPFLRRLLIGRAFSYCRCTKSIIRRMFLYFDPPKWIIEQQVEIELRRNLSGCEV